jgi:hypothetical protein
VKRWKIVKGNLDFVTVQHAEPGDHTRACHYRAEDVEAHARLVLLLAGDPDHEAALARIVSEERKILRGGGA